MPSVAQLKEFTIAPLHGAILGALILAAAWMIGVPAAFGAERTVAIPIAIAIGALLGRWFLRQLAWLALALSVIAALRNAGVPAARLGTTTAGKPFLTVTD